MTSNLGADMLQEGLASRKSAEGAAALGAGQHFPYEGLTVFPFIVSERRCKKPLHGAHVSPQLSYLLMKFSNEYLGTHSTAMVPQHETFYNCRARLRTNRGEAVLR